jgi:alkylation response protein AidB-like acyl-CoA dehydrogenase
VDFELSEEQAALRSVSRDLLADLCPPAVVRETIAAGLDLPEELWVRGAEMGWTGLLAPPAAGGTGQGVVELTLLAEELGRALVPGPFLETALAAPLLPGLSKSFAEGERKAALVHHGPISARPDGHELRLDGRARLSQAAAATDWLLITAGDHLVMVPTSETVISRRRTLDETRTWYDVDLTGVRVPAAYVVEAEVARLADTARVLTAADALGVGERLLELTVQHVKMRHQFGGPLGRFQVIKHKLADMHLALTGLRAATYYAAMTLDAGHPEAPLAAAVAKAYAAETIPALAGQALQTHGGIGFTWEHDLHLYLRRARVDAVLFGDAAFHHDRIATRLAAAPQPAG